MSNTQTQNSPVLPKPASFYYARRVAAMVCKIEESGAFGVYIPYALLNADVAHEDVHIAYLQKIDGTIIEGAVQALKKVFPAWTSADPYDLENVPLNDDVTVPEFRLSDCSHETNTDAKGNTYINFRARWINPVDGGPNRMPEKMDAAARKKWATQNAAKFKAILAASAPASKPADASAAKPATGGPPGRKSTSNATSATPRTSDQNTAWTNFFNRFNAKSQDEVGDKFYAIADGLFPDTKGDLNPTQWGAVEDELDKVTEF